MPPLVRCHGTTNCDNFHVTVAGLLSCGVKIGPVFEPALPFRHVNYSSTLRRHFGPFLASAGDAFGAVWTEYYRCKASATCRPTLCAASHITEPRWRNSPLARELVDDAVSNGRL